jgi:L-ascorbate metabolism protein UlaG (beta-lactamase superfamily)
MDITVTFVGNATTLISAGGLTLLTDPNFLHRGQRAYLGHGLVSKRLKEPALRISELPPIDAIVLSHMHGDHWDRVSQKGLDHELPVVTTPHAAKRLHKRGFAHARGLTTWQQHTITKGRTTLTLTSLPGRHAPGWSQRLLPPVMGTMLEVAADDGSPRRRLYISGRGHAAPRRHPTAGRRAASVRTDRDHGRPSGRRTRRDAVPAEGHPGAL